MHVCVCMYVWKFETLNFLPQIIHTTILPKPMGKIVQLLLFNNISAARSPQKTLMRSGKQNPSNQSYIKNYNQLVSNAIHSGDTSALPHTYTYTMKMVRTGDTDDNKTNKLLTTFEILSINCENNGTNTTSTIFVFDGFIHLAFSLYIYMYMYRIFAQSHGILKYFQYRSFAHASFQL